MIALFGFSVPTFLISSFGVLCSKVDYNVAEKKINKQEGKDSPMDSERKIIDRARRDETPESKSKD